jgi:hypothetical protein
MSASTLISSAAARQSLPRSKIFKAGKSAYSQEFNRTSFMFGHNLAGHPLFERARLAELAIASLAKRGPKSVRWQNSDSPIDAGWDVPLNKQLDNLAAAIANVEKSKSWVLLYSVQHEPEYRSLLDDVMEEIGIVTDVKQDDITWQDAYIFIASPHSLTPYHIDHELTFLFQVYGERRASLWNPEDRAVLTETEIERYYAGDLNAAVYKRENQYKSNVYTLSAGRGVHHPSLAPHSYQNGSTYSVALGVHFCHRNYDRNAKIYQVNHCLRKLGLKPVSPGQSDWRDQMKSSTLSLFSKRKPVDKNELLRSGINRLTYPIKLVQQLKRSS